jgi:hypothetical protein
VTNYKMVAAPATAGTKPTVKQSKSKNQYKREKAKLRKAAASKENGSVVRMHILEWPIYAHRFGQNMNGIKQEDSDDDKMDSTGDVEYVVESFDMKDSMENFSNVFARFKPLVEEISVCKTMLETGDHC